MKPKVFVTRQIPDAGLTRLREAAEADVWEEQLPPPRAVLMERIAGCEGLLCLLTDTVDAEVMNAGARLKVISNYAVGYDNIDVAAAKARGIAVGNTPGVLTETTADLAWALLMALARRVVEAEEYVRAGHWRTWEPQLLLGHDVQGATLGIIGLGRIGQALARRARGFGMRALYTELRRKEDAEAELGVGFAELDDLLRQSDFVSIHCNLTPETHHLIGARELLLMGPQSFLINTARGPVVDEAALVRALRSGVIFGAGLDVTDQEPIQPDNPLPDMPNVVVTPHMAGRAIESEFNAAENTVANVARLARGERPQWIVPPV